MEILCLKTCFESQLLLLCYSLVNKIKAPFWPTHLLPPRKVELQKEVEERTV